MFFDGLLGPWLEVNLRSQMHRGLTAETSPDAISNSEGRTVLSTNWRICNSTKTTAQEPQWWEKTIYRYLVAFVRYINETK